MAAAPRTCKALGRLETVGRCCGDRALYKRADAMNREDSISPEERVTECVSRQLPDEAATAGLASELASLARAGDVILLLGDLGAGKSVFARAFINALPGPREEVPSPTFTLVQTYQRGTQEVWHFDLYRLESADEAWELGFEEALGGGISLIEWPERLGDALPASRLEIKLRYKAPEAGRDACLTPFGNWRERLETHFGQNAK